MKRLFRQPISRQQSGDTIVEVLVAIAIVSAVLVGAFLVSNHSTQAVQDSQEHAEAEQYLQGQVEELRAALQSGQSVPIITSATYCYNGASLQQFDPTSSNPCAEGTSNRYDPQITVSGNTYDCKITWASIEGGTASEEFFYRDYASS